MTLRLITPPTTEPISLPEAKLHLRVTDSAEDALISTLIMAARMDCEQRVCRSFVQTEWEAVLDGFPANGVRLTMCPVMAVSSVKYVDEAGTLQTAAANTYLVDSYSEPGWVLPAYGLSWPTTLDTANAVRVRYTAGYGVDATLVPAALKAWMLLSVGALYENRELVTVGTQHAVLDGFNRLLDGFWVPRL